MRLIDADKLTSHTELSKVFNKFTDEFYGICQLVAEQPTVNQWIPCSERLPEVTINPITNDYQKYNITFKSEMNGIEIYDTRQYSYGVASGGNHWLHEGQIMDKYVTAWQPLPEPYKEEE